MTHHMLFASLEGMPDLLPWQADLASRGIVVLRAGRLQEALAYCRAYPLMLVLLDVPSVSPALLEAARQLREQLPPGAATPLIGLYRAEPDGRERAALAEAGFDDLIGCDDPPRFILWRLQTLAMLDDLRQFQQTRMDVAHLAVQTRERLHDLSQPLSAVQGRLQLLASRCPHNDPNAEQFHELVRLIFEVSKQVMEIHQMHRRFS